MKKRLRNIILSAFAVFAFCTEVSAATLAIGSDSTTAGAANKSVTVELKDADLKDYSKVEFKLSIDGTSYASIGTYDHKSSLGFNSDGGTYTIGDTSGELYETTTGSISYRTTANLNSNFKITPVDVKFYKKDGTVLQNGDAGIKVLSGTITYEKEKSKEATLTGITVSQGTLTPEFNKDIKEYTVVVKDTIPSIRINGTPCPLASVTGGGTKSIQMGENTVELIVTAEDKVTKNTYVVKVIRGEVAEPSAYLKNISINNIGIALSPEFDSKNNKYTVKVDKDIKSLNLKCEAEDPLAEVKIEGNEDFKLGENEIVITVTSSDKEQVEVYNITVIMEEEESVSPILDENKDIQKKDGPKWWLIILIVSLIVFIVIGISVLLFMKKKKNANKASNSTAEANQEKEPIERVTTRIEKSEISENEEALKNEDSITEMLKNEAFEDEETRRYDASLIKEFRFEDEDESSEYDDKTKEFNFKDFQ